MTAAKPDVQVGKHYGRLAVVGKATVGWLCNCSCGTTGVQVRATELRIGHKKSCGCIEKEKAVPKTEAKQAGRTRYFTGKPCRHGHLAERMVSNGACVVCLRFQRVSTPEKRKKDNARRLRMSKSTPEKRKQRNRRERLRPSGRIARALRNRLALAIKNNARAGSAVRDLGCTIAELKDYLAVRFLKQG